MTRIAGVYRFVHTDEPTGGDDFVFTHQFEISVMEEDDEDEETPGESYSERNTYHLEGTSRLLLVQVANAMEDDNQIAHLLQLAFLSCYFGPAQQEIPGMRYGATVKSSFDTCLLHSVSIDRFNIDEIIQRREKSKRTSARKSLKIARTNPVRLFADKARQDTWRPRKGEHADLSFTGKKDAKGKPIPSHVARWETRSIGGKRKLVLIERKIEARRQKDGTYRPVFKPTGKWLFRPTAKAVRRRAKK